MMDKAKLKALLDYLWKSNGFPYDYDILDEVRLCVCVEDGDWKHDHIRLTNIMSCNGFYVAEQQVKEEEDGFLCDSYTCTYVFEYM